MPTVKHTHKYKLVKTGKGRDGKDYKVYSCQLTGCSHNLPNIKFIIGKLSICWQCNEEFEVMSDTPRLPRPIVRPRCLVCRGKAKKIDKKLDDAMSAILGIRL